jgi:outer membrane protein OmpA-like peptidoglycan-associated protein
MMGFGLDDDIGTSDEGFGPGTDLIVAVLAVLLVMLATLRLTAVNLFGEVDTSYLTESKKVFWQAVEEVCGSKVNQGLERGTTLTIECRNTPIFVTGYAVYDTFSFGAEVVFPPDESTLSNNGRLLLRPVREFLAKSQDRLMEVQIAGHADWDGESANNLALGADRAREVYRFLTATQSGGLDPARVLVSATTYGEYRPISRDPRSTFTVEALEAANRTRQDKQRNRRIEISVYYRPVESGGQAASAK